MDSIHSRMDRIFHSRWSRLIAVVAINCLMVAVLTGAAVAKYSVIITDESAQTIVFTSEENPVAILEHEAITLGAHDKYEFSGFTDQKATLDIKRAKQITVNSDGKITTTHTLAKTIGAALEEMGITVQQDDFINVSLLEPMSDNAEITINRVLYQTKEVVEEIPYKTISFPTRSLKAGAVKVLKAGVEGSNTSVYAQKLIDGVVVENELVSTVTVEPTTARVQTGDPKGPVSLLVPPDSLELDANGNPVSYSAKYTGKATAYSALGNKTALKPGNVAMDLRRFPKGTKLYIKTPNGGYIYGYSTVRDTGTALQEGTVLVDVFFNSYEESCSFGAKTVDVYVLN